MIVSLLGVRGSTPESGTAFEGVGGHTSCVAIAGTDGRLLVLDAGTGFRSLAAGLGSLPFRGSILLTHLHWDHVIGLPFLANADREDAEVDLYLPLQGDGPPDEFLTRMMSPPTFPIEPSQLRGAWRRLAIDVGSHRIEGFDVVASPISHKGGVTFGYRVADGATSIAYLPDHSPNTATPEQMDHALGLASGVDVLLHGGQFLDHERRTADAFGHATISDATDFADRAEVSELVLIHHAPGRTDAQVDAAAPDSTPGGRPVRIGRQGMEIVA